MKFIHAADIHLDSPLRGLARYEGAPVQQIRQATRQALMNLVEQARLEAVDFILLAGDLYDGDWKDYNTGLFFNEQMTRLSEVNIPVFMVLGNHDATNSMTRALRLPSNVTQLDSQRPQTVCLEQLGVAIHGQSFASRSVSEDLSQHYPPALKGYYNIGLLHTSLTGSQHHATYAPCRLESLLAHGYDYWALGHIHQQNILHKDPWIVFPGNLQGRHIRETGPKGCLLVHVDPAQRTTVSPLNLDVLRWETCHLNLNTLTNLDELLDEISKTVTAQTQQAEGRPLALRLILEGNSPLHHPLHQHSTRWLNEIRAVSTEAGTGSVWIEKIIPLTTAPVSLLEKKKLNLPLPLLGKEGGTENPAQVPLGPLEELLNLFETLSQDEQTLHNLGGEFQTLKMALPYEIQQGEWGEGLDPDNIETVKRALEGAKALLLARLTMPN